VWCVRGSYNFSYSTGRNRTSFPANKKAASQRPFVIPRAVIGLSDRLRLPLPAPAEQTYRADAGGEDIYKNL
jgi:hypothetical protein